MGKWTFLTNHALVFSYLAKHPMITGIEVSREVGITERAVRKIIADLEQEGYVAKNRKGRRVYYRIKPRLPLRHDTQRDKVVGDLLGILGWKRKPKT